jgi:hypothetical protein
MLVVGVLMLGSGCSVFRGEWVEDGTIGKDGAFTPTTTDRRMALRFEPPATVRYGYYSESADVVEADSVQDTDYATINGRSVAEFGAYSARVKDDQMFLHGPMDWTIRLTRLHDRAVFPPTVYLPKLSRTGTVAPSQPQLAPVPAPMPSDAIAEAP